jgi:hypothetical protein
LCIFWKQCTPHEIIIRFIIGCSIFTWGIITNSYLHGINEIQLLKLHLKNTNKKEIDHNYNEYRDYTIAYIFAISGISVIAYTSILALNKNK